MADSMDDLIARLDRKRVKVGFEQPFLRHGRAAFDRIAKEIGSGTLSPREAINGLYVLFALLRCCPDCADSLLQIAVELAQEEQNKDVRGYAATTAVRVALVAEHPAVHVATKRLHEVRCALEEALKLGLSNQDQEYVQWYLEKERPDPGNSLRSAR